MSGPSSTPRYTWCCISSVMTRRKYEKGTDGDRMLPGVAMVLINPIAVARLELERANVLLIHVNKTTIVTCDWARINLIG
jgi:hypothetical protein